MYLGPYWWSLKDMVVELLRTKYEWERLLGMSIAQLVNTSKSMKMSKYFYTANLRIEAVHSFHDQ